LTGADFKAAFGSRRIERTLRSERYRVLFNSYLFWAFFAVVFVLYRVLPHRGQNLMLLAASYVFYGAWDWRFLSLIVFSTCVDYVAALGMDAPSAGHVGSPRRRWWLVLSVVVNLSLLGFFKYYGFFARELASLLGWLGAPLSLPSLEIVLPVGISFYTFQTMSYTIDVYRGRTPPTRRFLDFALYVSFFPQLVAGPIERSTHLMPQVLSSRRSQPGDFAEGLRLVVTGMFMKVVIADNMAEIANGVFESPMSELSGLDCLLGVYAFALQIYGDFSGYSTIAQGVAKWLGFDLMVNFNQPYFAQTPREFWHRWHISLSTWLRDYLYVPLGGSRYGTLYTYRNLMLTMVLGGLWHGAAWTFVWWGIWHGGLLCIDRWIGLSPGKRAKSGTTWLGAAAQRLLTFHLVCVGWLLFRAQSMEQTKDMLVRIVTDAQITKFSQFAAASIAFYALPLLVYEIWLFRGDDLGRITKVGWPLRAAVYSYVAIMILLFYPTERYEFIYFQF
jgi:D-alanyl-lipoteichoic acid acyltransferase DltB (MBOAT superfamily)